MSNEDISVRVNIGDRIYPLKIKIREEEFVRKAAKLINEKMTFYNNSFSVKDNVDGLAMAALEFAVEAINKANQPASSTDVTDTGALDKQLSNIEHILGLH